MKEKASKQEAEDSVSTSNTPPIDRSRRKVARLGLTAPVILALASRPVLGGTANCQYSVQLSGNLSGHHTDGDGTWLDDPTVSPEDCQDAP